MTPAAAAPSSRARRFGCGIAFLLSDAAGISGEFHGILSGTFNDLDGSGQGTDLLNGLRGSIVLNLHNDLGVPIGGPLAEEFGLIFLGNNDLRSDTENNPAGIRSMPTSTACPPPPTAA